MKIGISNARKIYNFKVVEEDNETRFYYNKKFIKVNFSINDDVYVWKRGSWLFVYAENEPYGYASWQAYMTYNKKQLANLEKESKHPTEDKIYWINELFSQNPVEDFHFANFWEVHEFTRAKFNFWRM